jgi:hypothetical protein
MSTICVLLPGRSQLVLKGEDSSSCACAVEDREFKLWLDILGVISRIVVEASNTAFDAPFPRRGNFFSASDCYPDIKPRLRVQAKHYCSELVIEQGEHYVHLIRTLDNSHFIFLESHTAASYVQPLVGAGAPPLPKKQATYPYG